MITLALLIALLYYGWNYINWLMVHLCSRGENCESNHWREPEKNVIRDGPLENLWNPGHAVANIELVVAIHSSANRSTHISHIIIFQLTKAFAAGSVKSVWSIIAILGILPIAVLYFMRSANALLFASYLLIGLFTFLIKWRFISMSWLHDLHPD